MGICYQLILADAFDFNYVGRTKEQSLELFTKEYMEAGAYCCDLVAQWPYYAVFDVDKRGPFLDRLKVIKKYSDNAWYNMDISVCTLTKIE